MMITDKLRIAVKTSPTRQYRLAHEIDVHPSVLSSWLNGIVYPRADDPRIVKLGRLVGVPPDECFNAEQ